MRLTADEIRKNKQVLAEWYPPTEMREHATHLMDRLGCEDLFNQPDVDFICEAWIAAELGEQRGASAVRLIAEERPDFALRFDGGVIENYELVEVDHFNRRRGDEYAALAAAGCPIYHWPVEEWATAEQAFSSIRAMAEKKAEKAKSLAARGIPYPKHTQLLFYVNLGDFGTHTQDIENVFSTAVEPARKWFSSIWVLWKKHAYQLQ